MCQRARQLGYQKYRRFLQKELKLDDFIARQLNDTRYIARLAGEYLRCLFDQPHHVLGLKGQLTAELRHQWGLDRVLAELPDSPAWHQQPALTAGEKNRADHRHHAIDALIIALTTRSRLQRLAQIRQADDGQAGSEPLDLPWIGFREEVKRAVARLHVSHRAERKVHGGLHEDTLYGLCERAGEWAVRKPVDSLTPNEVERIRDETVRGIVLDSLRRKGIEFGRGKKPDAKKMKEALAHLAMPSGVPIKKVRVLKPEETIRPLRLGTQRAFVKPGSTHHLCVFRWKENGKWRRGAVFISMLEAARRAASGQPVIQRAHPDRPEAAFVMSLSPGELVLAQTSDGEKLLVFRTAPSTTGQLRFVEHCDARQSGVAKKYLFTANTLQAKKVTVDAIGRVRWAEKKFWSAAEP